MRRKLILLNSGLLLLGAVVLTAQAPPPTLSANAQALSAACVAMGGAKGVCDQDAMLHELTITGQSAYQKLVSAQFTADEAKESGDIQNLTNSLTALDSKQKADEQTIANLSSLLAAATPVTVNVPANACTLTGAPNGNQQPHPTSLQGNIGGFELEYVSLYGAESATCTVTIPTAGNYFVTAALSSPMSGHTLHIELPAGTNVSGEITASNTGGWATSFSRSVSPVPLALPAGPASFVINFEVGGFNYAGLRLDLLRP